MRKVFIFSIITLIFGVILLGVYNLAFKKEESLTDSFSFNESSDKEKWETSENEKIKKILEKEIISPVIVENKYIQFFHEGNIERVTLDGSINSVVLNKDANIIEAVWAPEKDKVVYKNQQGEFYLFDYKLREEKKLKEGLDDVIWTNLKDRIIYKYFDSTTKERTINLANPDGSSWKILSNLGVNFKRIKIAQVPHTPFIAYWNYPDGSSSTSMNLINIIGGEPKEIIQGNMGADYLWSPDGSKVLTTFVKNNQLILGVYDDRGENFKNLNTPTLVSKCAWMDDNENIICAVPVNIPEGSSMPEDYLEGKVNTKDVFWTINLKNGKRNKIVEESEIKEEYDVENLFISPSGDRFFFINRLDGHLYRVLR